MFGAFGSLRLRLDQYIIWMSFAKSMKRSQLEAFVQKRDIDVICDGHESHAESFCLNDPIKQLISFIILIKRIEQAFIEWAHYFGRETFIVLVLGFDHLGNIEISIGSFELLRVRIEQRHEIVVIVHAFQNQRQKSLIDRFKVR